MERYKWRWSGGYPRQTRSGLLDDVTRLVLFVEPRIQGDGVATLSLRPQTLTQPPRIAGNQAVGRFQNDLGGAIVSAPDERFLFVPSSANRWMFSTRAPRQP